MIYSLVGGFFFPFTTTSFISINTQMYICIYIEREVSFPHRLLQSVE